MLRRIGQSTDQGRITGKTSNRRRRDEYKDRMKISRFGLHGIEMPCLNASLAAIVRSRHVHAATTAVHVAAAAMLLRRHPGVRNGAGHDRREQRQRYS